MAVCYAKIEVLPESPAHLGNGLNVACVDEYGVWVGSKSRGELYSSQRQHLSGLR